MEGFLEDKGREEGIERIGERAVSGRRLYKG